MHASTNLIPAPSAELKAGQPSLTPLQQFDQLNLFIYLKVQTLARYFWGPPVMVEVVHDEDKSVEPIREYVRESSERRKWPLCKIFNNPKGWLGVCWI